MSYTVMVKQATAESAAANRIERLADGSARVPAKLQAIEAYAAPDVLTIVSTLKGKPGSFSIRPLSLGRTGSTAGRILAGNVVVEKDRVIVVRKNMVEELTTSAEGVRQDFVIKKAPEGAGELGLDLLFEGATLHEKGEGIVVTLPQGRQLLYHRLVVTDSEGKNLPARFELHDAGRLRIVVADAGARYPVRIDPTVSDANWTSLSSPGPDMNGTVYALAWDGTNLYAGGDFTTAGGTSVNHIAKWNGSAWSALATGMNSTVRALAWDGTNLYAGGAFTKDGANAVTLNYIAKWNGSAWSALATGMNNAVYALAWDGTNLYAGGDFTTAGGTSVNHIAKWNGTSWSALGAGLGARVYALAWDGTNLYAGGRFLYVEKWDGGSWSALGGGTIAPDVYALAWDGTNLYVGGDFSLIGGISGTSALNIAKWDGTTWSALGAGINKAVWALAWDGTNLYAGGEFLLANGTVTPASRIAKWNGSTWSALGTGLNMPVWALAWKGTNLYAGGNFTKAGGSGGTTLDYIAYFEAVHTVTASAGPKGGISPDSRSVFHGETTTFTVTPDTGYAAAVDSTCGSGSLVGDTYTTAAVMNSCAVTATFTATFVCGNGATELGETCDDGNTVTETACPYGTPSCTACSADCSQILNLTGAYCGDGITNGSETCDDGANNGQPNKCNTSCSGITASVCGNGIVESGETCDDGNTVTETACPYGTTSCTACSADCSQILNLTGAYCGDAITNGSETCDDGANNGQPNKCNTSCSGTTASVCGNGVIEAGEQCDDGNLTSGDGCSSTCTTEICPPTTSFSTSNTTLTFDNLTTCGTVTVTGLSNPSPPSNFRIPSGDAYEIAFDGTFSGNVQVCLTYNDAGFYGNENDLKLFHYTNTGWVDITTSLDTTNNTICGVTSSLSPFAIVEPLSAMPSTLVGYNWQWLIITLLSLTVVGVYLLRRKRA